MNKEIKQYDIENADDYIRSLLSDGDEDYNYKTYKKDKTIVPFTYLSEKDFEDFRGEHAVKIIGDVYFTDKYKEKKNEKKTDEVGSSEKEVKKTSNKKKKKKNKKTKKVIGCLNVLYTDKYIEKHSKKDINDKTKKFNIYKQKSSKCSGYAYIGNDNFIRICKHNYIVPILLVLLCIAGIILLIHTCTTGSLLPTDNTSDYQKNQQSDLGTAEKEKTQFRGFTNLYVSSDEPYITFDNPEGNTVYFKYSVYLDDNKDSIADSKDPVYTTDLIEPGKMLKGDLKSKIETGEHTLLIIVDTYDINTNKECTGTYFNNVGMLVKE